jgi:membrane protease YdiL (CAAX protease family)
VTQPAGAGAAAFFALLFALSIPFYLLGEVGLELLPGLPISSLMVACPMLAALILAWRNAGKGAARALVRRAFDWRRLPPVWYLPAILLMPAVMAASYLLMQWTGRPVPAPRFDLLSAAALFALFFAGAVAEEIGWTGYALEQLQRRWSALAAALVLGAVWAAWHVVPLLQVQRPWQWIGWWCLGTVSARIITVWLYNNAGRSVFAAVLFHAMSNLGWQLFPVEGSHYDPAFTAPLQAALAILVTLLYGPASLAGRDRR